MDDPVAFAADRLDEDERELVKDPPAGLGYANLAGRMRREVEAGRRILARHAECAERGTGPCWEFPIGQGVMCRELADLLIRWYDHPCYRPEWKP